MSMPSRRSLLSCVLGPVALTGALLGVNRASARLATPELVGIDGWLNLPEKRFSQTQPAEHFYANAFRFDEMSKQWS